MCTDAPRIHPDANARFRSRRPRGAALLVAATLLATALACAPRPPATGAARAPLLRAGTSGDYAPFSSVDAHGARRGLDIDIASRLAADLGFTLELVPFRWPELAGALTAGGFDLAISGITMRPERALRARSTRPYAATGVVVLLRADDAAVDLAALDAAPRRIGVNAGGYLEQWARRRFARATVVAVADNQSLPDQLAAASVDAIVTDSAEAPHWLRPGWRALGPLTADYKAIFFGVEAEHLAERVDAWLAAREADGWLAAKRRQWLGDAQAADAAAATRQALVSWIALRCGLMPAVAASKRAAGLAIEDVAQEERVLAGVAAQATRRPDAAVALYRQLIETAKAIQRRSADAAPAVALVELRAALGRIDRQLLRALEGVPPTAADTWRHLLHPALTPLLAAAEVEEIAAALAGFNAAAR